LHKVSGDTIEDMLRESLSQIFGTPDSTRRRPVLLLSISLLLSLSAGVGEEVLFRGALQPLVASLTRSDALGVGLSSLLFAALHAATPRYLLLAFILSGYLGWVQIGSGNLLIPILVHTLFDVVGFALSLFTGKGKGKSAT
jgi:membrane protease YdiL (CAAX protease family)